MNIELDLVKDYLVNSIEHCPSEDVAVEELMRNSDNPNNQELKLKIQGMVHEWLDSEHTKFSLMILDGQKSEKMLTQFILKHLS